MWLARPSTLFVAERQGATHSCMDQVRVLHDLGEEETFLHVLEAPAAGGVDVVDGTEAGPYSRGCVDSDKGVPGPVSVHLVARSPIDY